jgi:hypothetical protein
MIDIAYKWKNLVISTSKEKKEIVFHTDEMGVILDGYDVTFPGEYEKSGILLEVKEYAGILFYKFLMLDYHLVIIQSDSFELTEEILWFFGDVDILVIKWTKAGVKIYENVEAKLVVPYGEEKDIFFNTLGQNKESVLTYRIKGELNGEITEFVNLSQE